LPPHVDVVVALPHSLVKAHYIEQKLATQNPFLESKSSDFSKKKFKWF
jgi:hypothetical protein